MRGATNFNWTDAHVERAKQMRREGYSFADIAAALGGGLSTNAVIGKCRRASITGGNKRKGPRRARAKPQQALVPIDATATSVRFLDRKMHVECCAILNSGAPIEELLVCGAPIPIESAFDFCEAHGERFLTPNTRAVRVPG